MSEDLRELNRLLQQIEDQGKPEPQIVDFLYLLLTGFAVGLAAGVWLVRF